jgi:hypothetical protein
MSKQTNNRTWLALAAVLLAAGLACAQDAANSKPATDENEPADKPEVVIEKGDVPVAPKSAAVFQTQKILDAFATPVVCSIRRWMFFQNGTISPRAEKTATLKFDAAWPGIFRHDFSHNAAWIFFKVRTEGSSEWQPVRLAADKVMNPAGYGCEESTSPIDLMVPNGADGFTGMFLRLADQSPETELKAKGITAIWDFSANKGITKDTKVEIRVFAIRMMYITKGPYCLGSGGRERYGFYQYTDEKQDTLPFKVTGPGAIPTGKQPGRLWARGMEPDDGGEIPATFPNGYAAFYCMTTPLEHGEYAAYLNALSPEEQEKRFVDDPAGAKDYKGMVSRIGEAPNYVFVQAGFRKGAGIWNLSYLDAALYTAWAGLRPMTELEYEKALRGFRDPLPDEAGYSYWGMNFGGGIYNNQPRMRMVSVIDNEVRRTFKGTHGLGTLALPDDWPKQNAVGVTTRGGWGATDSSGFADIFRTSDRHLSDFDAERRAGFGWRAVRTAPVEAEWNTARGETAEAPAKSGK